MTQGPYHLISIGLLLIVSYFFSQLLVRIQLISKVNHKKFWNALLLLFFLTTALLGLILAIKVNYKMEIPWIESAMQWHVDLGTGFAFVAFFHLMWHLRYYRKLNSQSADSPVAPKWLPHLSITPIRKRLFFVLLGYIGIMAQLALLREIIKTLHGNELVIGIFLALWMIMTAFGAWAGSVYRAKVSFPSLLKLMLILATSPLIVYILLILIHRLFFLPGYEPGLMASMAYIVLLAGPFTLISGFLFAYVSKSFKEVKSDAKFYMFDSLGSLVGGLLFGLILVFFFDNIQILTILVLSTVLAVILVFRYPFNVYKRVLLLFTCSLLFILFLIPGIKNSVEGLRYKGEKILDTKDTPYGNLTFTEREGQVTGYLDRNPVLSSTDLARVEEMIHFPALQHPAPSSFLLLGGGLSGTSKEVAKYKPGIFDYCEADPWIYRLGRQHLPPSHSEHFNFIPLNGRSWLIKADSLQYDVIISAAGDPYTIGWNRFFTREFYKLVDDHLAPGGIFCMQLTTGGNYINDRGSELLSINYHTLKEVFRHVVVMPGQATYFLASAQPLSLDFPALLEEHGIQTTYVHPDYLDVFRSSFDSDMLMERIQLESSGINMDLWPRLFFTSLSVLESRMGSHSLVITGIISLLVFLLLLFFYPPRKAGMYITGFTGAGIQIMLIMVMQSLYGFAYMVTPVMITIFMAGIVTGTLVWKPFWRTASVLKIAGLIWIMALVAAIAVILLKDDHIYSTRWMGQWLLGLLNFIPGIIVGSVYGMTLELPGKENSGDQGRLFSADLAGAAFGTFVPVVFILPLIGVANTFILFCGINVATGLYILTRWR